MNKTEAIRKALEQSFWSKYPQLNAEQDYAFKDLFPQLNQTDYVVTFWHLVESNELPLIPVIPLQSHGSITRVALDYS